MEASGRFEVVLVAIYFAIMITDGKILNWTNPEINSTSGSGFVNERIREGSCGSNLGIQIQATTDKRRFPFPMYSIIEQHPEGFQFSIDKNFGYLTLESGSLDYDRSTHVVLIVKVNDGEAVGTATGTIRLIDINDNAPVFPTSNVSVVVHDKPSEGFHVATVKAHDRDATFPDNRITYEITDGNTNGDFSIDRTEGIITVSEGKTLENATVQNYSLLIMAMDGGVDPGALKASMVVNVYMGQGPNSTGTSGSTDSSGLSVGVIVLLLAVFCVLY